MCGNEPFEVIKRLFAKLNETVASQEGVHVPGWVCQAVGTFRALESAP